MKNRSFFHLQYDRINWANQEKTRINEHINKYLINEVILKHPGNNIAVFDIGFGIGLFIKMLYEKLPEKFDHVTLAGCEPSQVNYQHFAKKLPRETGNVSLTILNGTFENVRLNGPFDFITAVYVFPHFLATYLSDIVKKIASLLKERGKFILVVANERYLKEKLAAEKDLFIEKSKVRFNGKQYEEVLHYTDIPDIGKVIDINREERFYIDLFETNSFLLIDKKEVSDNGFLCNVFMFEKK